LQTLSALSDEWKRGAREISSVH